VKRLLSRLADLLALPESRPSGYGWRVEGGSGWNTPCSMSVAEVEAALARLDDLDMDVAKRQLRELGDS
jgi:hypothetical protein